MEQVILSYKDLYLNAKVDMPHYTQDHIQNTNMSDTNTTPMSGPSARTPSPTTSSSSWQSVSEAPSEAPLRCFHLRLLHAKCGHVSFLDCHESPCEVQHVGWMPEKTPPEKPSSCFEMKHYIRIKDAHCKVCQSYLDSSLARTTSALRGWLGMNAAAEKSVNHIALPQDMVDAIVEGWRIQMDHMKAQKLQFEAEQKERMQVCTASAQVEQQGDSSGNAQETVVYVESDERAKSSDSEWLLTFE